MSDERLTDPEIDWHEHAWQPVGLIARGNCGLVPTDVCACGLWRFGGHGFLAAGTFASAMIQPGGTVHLVRVANLAAEPGPLQSALCGQTTAIGWRLANAWTDCPACNQAWRLMP